VGAIIKVENTNFKDALRSPFMIILPIIMFGLINLAIVLTSLSSVRKESGYILENNLKQHNLIVELAEINERLVTNHKKISEAINDAASNKKDMLDLYRIHSNGVDTLASIDKMIALLTKLDFDDSDLKEKIANMQKEFYSYRSKMIMTTDIISIDPQLAIKYVGQAQEDYINYALYSQETISLISHRMEMVINAKINSIKFTFLKTGLITLFSLIVTIILIALVLYVINRYILSLVTLAEQNSDRLNILYREKSELVATKDKFFSIIAHDLRSPFQVLIGFSEMILSNYKIIDDNEKVSLLHNIKDTSDRTLKLLDNLLVWAKSQSGKIRYKFEEINLSDLISGVYYEFSLIAQKKEIALSFDCNKGLTVYGDYNSLETIIRNLTTNAIKFTSKKGCVTIKAESYNIDENYIVVSVIDSGVGIPADDINRLFSIEKNFSTKGTDNESGTGLGLLLCKEFAEKNGGNIFVESTVGVGSTFYITIPKLETIKFRVSY